MANTLEEPFYKDVSALVEALAKPTMVYRFARAQVAGLENGTNLRDSPKARSARLEGARTRMYDAAMEIDRIGREYGRP